MTCNRRHCKRSSVTSTTLAVTAALFVLISVPGSASQRASVYAPVVVSAHDPAAANPMLGAAFSPSAHGASSSEAPAAQGQLHGAGSAAATQSPHVPSGHTDNDVHLQPSSPSLPAGTGNPTLHAEAREEADNRIADLHLPSETTASATPAAWPMGATDAADAADAATALPHANPTAARVPLWLDTIAPHVAVDVPHPTPSPGNVNGTQKSFSDSTVSVATAVPSSSAAPSVSQNVSSEANQTSRTFSDSGRRSIQYVSAGGQQNIPQVSSPSKGSSFGNPSFRKVIPHAAVVNATSTTTTSTTARDISVDAFVPAQNKTTETEDEAYSDEVFTEDPEGSTVDVSTVPDAIRDETETTTFFKLENDGVAPVSNASSLDDDAALETHPCARECVMGAPPMRCYYRFEVTGYYTMSKACYNCPASRQDCDLPECVAADGVPRGLVVVNRQMPGPAVEVCLGDRIVVDLHNGLVAETTSVHWHGHHQRGTPYMDGVPHVTQCPVPPMTTFRYAFKADTPGTHFWHSHTGHQRADGAFGSLVVRVPREADAHAALWDRDERAHTLLLLDWGASGGAERFLAHHHAGGPNKPTAILVNGRGRVPPSPLPDASASANNATARVPAPEFVVQQGLRYRFRLINAGFLNCPIELSVDDHDMLIIASDGSDIQPVAAASLVTYAGERFDFILEANRSVSTYWIRMRGLLDCGENFTAVHQVAILRYEGATEVEPPGELSYAAAHRPGHQVNSLNVGTGTAGSSVIPELDAIAPDDESLKEEPDYRFYLAYDFYAVDNPHFHKAPYYGFYNVSSKMQTYTPQFNHISMKMPSVPMLPQHEQLDQKQFCNTSSVEDQGCRERYCECSHVIQVPLHSVLEIVLIDEGVTYNANHPFHLHGYAFRVVGMERLGESTSLEEVKRLDEQGLLKRKLHAAPLKDTCTVPDGGYTILRVQANNPGYWLFHCHIEFHVEIGMALVFKIGEHSEFPPAPRGFPRCGDWTPDDDDDDDDDLDADVRAGAAPTDTHKSGHEAAHEDTSANEVASVGASQETVLSGAPHKSRLHETQPDAGRRSSAAAAMLSTSGLLLAILTSTFTRLCSR
ncbi:hypothetical protein R5R35_014805 [Gryllus longicercus]|uniref:Uncharacterized protein n=1 Tax=Gryllus longicercus TaxID=2509291 RepID=A0AAN9VSJ6_9ORTH